MSDPKSEANGTAPAPDGQPDGQATSGEKILAGFAFAFGVFILAMAIDMFTGGALGRLAGQFAKAPDDGG